MQKKRWIILIAILVGVGLIRASEWSLRATPVSASETDWAYISATLDPTLIAPVEPSATASPLPLPTDTSLPPTLTPNPLTTYEYDGPEEILLSAEKRSSAITLEAAATEETAPIITELFQLMNEERAKVGAPPLEYSPVLARVAQSHSEEMAKHNFFGHNSLNGLTFVNRIRNAGYNFTAAAENLFAGNGPYNDASYVINTWLRSTSHRENMLNPAYTEVGIGYGFNPDSTYGAYFTADFGTP
ncbi:MAG TPA: CAP domain-containing protein [Anaerolineaceae bacterium]